MDDIQANDSSATRAVIDQLIEHLHTDGPEVLGVVRDKDKVANSLARVEAQLRLLAKDDDGTAFFAALNKRENKTTTITMTADDLREHIALAEQSLAGTRDTLQRLREKKQRTIANALDPVAETAWMEHIEADLVKSERAFLQDLEQSKAWLPLAPVVLTRA